LCVFVGCFDGELLFVAVHVDDFAIAGIPSTISRFRRGMASKFKIKELGQAKFILGIQIKITSFSISISQETYLTLVVNEVIENTDPTIKALCTDFHSLSFPIISDNIRTCFSVEKDSQVLSVAHTKFFHHILGCFMYAMVCTRLDIAFTVNFLGRFMKRPFKTHLIVLLYLMRYIRGTLSLGITYSQEHTFYIITIYADSDWAGDHKDRKSTGRFLALEGGSPISWESRKQITVAHSSMKAEYITFDDAARKVV
jgi:hypothetical protein